MIHVKNMYMHQAIDFQCSLTASKRVSECWRASKSLHSCEEPTTAGAELAVTLSEVSTWADLVSVITNEADVKLCEDVQAETSKGRPKDQQRS